VCSFSKCAEQWDCALLSFTHKCKKMKVHRGSNLDKYVRSSAGMDINIVQRVSNNRQRASTLDARVANAAFMVI